MTKHFAADFFIGLLVFLLFNLLSAHLSSNCGLLAVFRLDSCFDDVARAGLYNSMKKVDLFFT